MGGTGSKDASSVVAMAKQNVPFLPPLGPPNPVGPLIWQFSTIHMHPRHRRNAAAVSASTSLWFDILTHLEPSHRSIVADRRCKGIISFEPPIISISMRTHDTRLRTSSMMRSVKQLPLHNHMCTGQPHGVLRHGCG